MYRCVVRKTGDILLQKPTVSIFRAARPSEKLVHIYQTTRRNIPSDPHLDPHGSENLKSQTLNKNFCSEK
jgi:hypothetical protein